MPRASTPRRSASRDAPYLRQLGERIREARALRGMTRAGLAADSGVSLRFLAQLEAGTGNPSVLVLRRITAAMGFSPDSLMGEEHPRNPDRTLILQLLHRLSEAELTSARELLFGKFGKGRAAQPPSNYVALIGLRGAGKTTLGRRLAAQRAVPFFELDREVERDYGATIGEIIQLHGQPGYRRYERDSLQEVLAKHPAAVIETGGGLAADPETLPVLLASAVTVWVRASPEEHMQRVIDQGDLRPMARSREAMRELTDILHAREPFYRQAHCQLNTSGKDAEQSFAALVKLLEGQAGQERQPADSPRSVPLSTVRRPSS